MALVSVVLIKLVDKRRGTLSKSGKTVCLGRGQECLLQPVELDVKAKWGDSCGDRSRSFLCLAAVRVRCGRWLYLQR